MRNKSIDNAVAWLLVVAGPIVSLFLTMDSSTDPVNVSKMLVLAPLAFAVIGLLLSQWKSVLSKEIRWVSISVLCFELALVLSVLFSSAPTTQLIYGTFGRNTGLITYSSLLFLYFGASLVRKPDFANKLVKSLMVVGIINALYGVLQLTHNDPLPWNNVYNTILGTFGNPDFVSAFLGMSVVLSFSWLFSQTATWKIRGLLLCYSALALFEIKKSHAIQGFAVTAIGFAIIGYFLVRSWFKKKWISIGYLAGSALIALVAVMGALQTGPLANFIYKKSISLRGEYWYAAFGTAKSHPIFGVGLDSFGDWYRQERHAPALGRPNSNTVVNTAHNVFLDMAANGGLVMFLAYSMLTILVLVSTVKVIRRTSTYDATFVGLLSVWIGYQAQSIISINQIGLAIWGWLFGGALIAYEVTTRQAPVVIETLNRKIKRQRNSAKITGQSLPASALLAGFATGLIGLLVTLPAFVADANWFKALNSQKVEQVHKAALAWPMDSSRINFGAQTLIQNKFNFQALELARKARKFNPRSFDSWNLIYGISLETPIPETEKAEALRILKILDPLNPDIQKLK